MIKLIDILKEVKPNITYSKPNFEYEWGEAERYSEFVEMGKENWIKTAEDGYITKYSKIKDVLGNVDLNFDSLEEPKKERFNQTFNSGTIEMPIVVKFGENDYDLVAGNTRLAGLVKNKINPSVWVVEL